jgi:NADH-quinone oxidoreductase subunit M
MPDLNMREWWLLAPIAAAVLWMGIYPESFMRPIRNDVGRVLARVERAAPKGDSNLTLGAGAKHDGAGHHGKGQDGEGQHGAGHGETH